MPTFIDPAPAVDRSSPTCPLCHTLDHSITTSALAAGGRWRCVRCSQLWTAERLATAAAYAESGL